jgi:hypothetical protein
MKIFFNSVTKQAILMRRLTVLILPLQLAFPGLGEIIKSDERFDGGVERKASRKWEDAEEKRTKKDRNII